MHRLEGLFLGEQGLAAGGVFDALHEQRNVDVDPLLLERRNLGGRHIAAPGLQQNPVIRKLLLDPVHVDVGFVHLVDRDHDRHLGGARVVDRLDRLGHHTVVRCHHEDHDVGGLGAAGAHRGEGLVAGRVQEDDRFPARLDVVGADVLRDAPRLSLGNLRLPDRVEQGGLAVIHVAHNGYDRRPRQARRARGLSLLPILDGARELELFFERDHRGLDSHFFGDLDGGRGIECLVDGREDPSLDQEANDLLGQDAQLLRQLLDRHALGEEDGSGRERLLELQQLARVVRPRRLRGAPQRGLGNRPRLRRLRLLRLRALLDQGECDVRVGVFFVGADELPQIDLVGYRDLGLGPTLLGSLLGLFLVVLLALGRPAFGPGRWRGARRACAGATGR